jgi:DnaJ-class molecular chaperone
VTELHRKTHYEMLGLMPDASKEEIKERYREIARAYHPDSNFYAEIINDGLSGRGIETFKKITESYNILINDQKRLEYDRCSVFQLRSWDDEENYAADENQSKSSSSYAFGIFGSVTAQSSFDQLKNHRQRSVSEEIKRQQGRLWRFLNLIGF